MKAVDTSLLEGYFRKRYAPLVGRDWLRNLPDYERKAFSRIGFCCGGYGVLGGETRASTAKRDHRGRFV